MHFADAKLDERFWPKVNFVPDGCWLWTASIGGPGYGQIAYNKKPHTVHRLIWELYNGPIPKGMFVLHRCDVRRCCNPEHLFLGTPADNTKDMISKGRMRIVRPDTYASGESHGRSKLTLKMVVSLLADHKTGKFTQVELGEKYGISGPHVCGIIKGRFWASTLQALQSKASE